MDHSVAMRADETAPLGKPSNYPPDFAGRMASGVKSSLGDLFGLRDFGDTLTTLAPGAISASQHRRSRQDEFVFRFKGEAVLVIGGEETALGPWMCAGFRVGGVLHHLENRSADPVLSLEIGDRAEGDEGTHPADDLVALHGDGAWLFLRKDGSPY